MNELSFVQAIGVNHLAKMSIDIIRKSNTPMVKAKWLGDIQGILIYLLSRYRNLCLGDLTDGPSVLG